MRHRNARGAILLSAALVAVACSKPLDMAGLETQLGNDVNAMLKTTGITVSCPDGIKAESGGRFDCTATTTTGETFLVRVTQKDSNGNVVFSLQDAPTPSPSSST